MENEIMEKITFVFIGILFLSVFMMIVFFCYAWFYNMLLIKHVKLGQYSKMVLTKGYFKYIYDNDDSDLYLLKLKQKIRKGSKYSLICSMVIVPDFVIIALLIRYMSINCCSNRYERMFV